MEFCAFWLPAIRTSQSPKPTLIARYMYTFIVYQGVFLRDFSIRSEALKLALKTVARPRPPNT